MLSTGMQNKHRNTNDILQRCFCESELWVTETLTSYTSHTPSTRVSMALTPPRRDTRRKDNLVSAEHNLFYSLQEGPRTSANSQDTI